MMRNVSINARLAGLMAAMIICCSGFSQTIRSNPVDSILHLPVYGEDGRFAGWPANHGIWSWGSEVLVGFVAADHEDKSGHAYNQPSARDHYARSHDGGMTWSIEEAFSHGQTGWRYNNQLPEDKAVAPAALREAVDFNHPDLALTFLRATNSTGPSHFYYSYNRGKAWNGPFKVPDFGTAGVATRTDYLIDGRRDLTAFFTVAKDNRREGRILCARTRDGGLTWKKVAWVGEEPAGFEIMSSSVRLSPSDILTVVRARQANGLDLLVSYRSRDNGATWEKLGDPVADTGQGGSPPALIKMIDGRLALGYIYRSQYGSRVNVRFSSDNGATWSNEIMLRGGDGANRDVGYPRMIQRPDGKLIMVYYWNHASQPGAGHFRYIACTIFDPQRWK